MEKLESDYNIWDWFKKVYFKEYANFSGRARRAEYWYSRLMAVLIIIPLFFLMIFGTENDNNSFIVISIIVFCIIIMLAIIPTLAVTVRRFHDTNKSGWYFLLTFVPLGSLVLFIFTVIEGDRTKNKYGNDPKDISNFDEIDTIGLE